MLSPETVIAFIVASCGLAIAPGPDNIFVLTQSITHGPRAGILVVLGLCTGLIAHTLAVTLGFAAVFQNSALAFKLLKCTGAAYLLLLAWQAFRAPAQNLSSTPPIAKAALYRRGVLMNITNPKVSIFFLAFLPQFVSADSGPVAPQLISFGILFMLSTFVIFSLIALLSGKLSTALKRSPKAQSRLNKLAGLIFITLALKILSSQL